MLPDDLDYHDAGLLVWMVEYNHVLRWSGARWEWGPGDPGSGFIQHFVAAPQGPGWQLCDGSSTDYLVVDPIPQAIAFTTPDLVTNPVYPRSNATYTGTVTAPSGPTLSGSTGTPSATVAVESNTPVAPVSVGDGTHTHPVGTLAAAADGEPRHLDVLCYFRR